MEELRRHRRLQIPLRVEIRHPVIGTLEVPAADISDGGIFIKVDECFQLNLAESVIVRTLELGPNADETGPPLVMKVVRKTTDGMGLRLEETASASLRSLATEPTPRHRIKQSLFLVNSKKQILFTLQESQWRLPGRELNVSETWEQSTQNLAKNIKHLIGFSPQSHVDVQQLCYPLTSNEALGAEFVIPASAHGEVPASEMGQTNFASAAELDDFRWVNNLDIPKLCPFLDASLVDKLLSQV
ncbi:MAG: PilZ domain-containing protein [Pseudohongiellaceae bacterium]